MFNSALKDSKGKLWWGTTDGVVSIASKDMVIPNSIPKLTLNSIEVEQEFIDYGQLSNNVYIEGSELRRTIAKATKSKSKFSNVPQNLELPYNINDLSFQLSATEWNSPSKIMYQYVIDGLDNTWGPLLKSPNIAVQNIPYGNYTFKARAIGETGNLSNTIVYNFTIKPPWWHTWWARVLMTILVLSVIVVVFQLRIKAVRKKLKKEEAIRLQMGQLEAKALRAQMNPHFIFNSLNGIQSAIILKGEREANKYLTAFAKLLRFTLDFSHSEKISLKKEIQYINTYVDLEKLRQPHDINFTLRLEPEDMETSNIFLPSMMIQPLIENAILHGLIPKKSKNRCLQVTFKLREDCLYAVITDNGIGRKAATNIKARQKNEHISHANRIMKERIDTIKQFSTIDINMVIDDLYDGEKPMGTRVTLTFSGNYGN
ncbi:histidine kinase [uncultured Winogradskyella sp.]|uniref:sensor histidine kinase n=1 Tax=uncultured Winogradskyella sp. TaxID=395353 RepID=UPI002632BBCC|nr:histidine kinase [uncultured Winogradskyella sp.]